MLHRRDMLAMMIATGASLGLGACRQDVVYQSTGGQFPGTGTMEQREALIRRSAPASAGWSIQPMRSGLQTLADVAAVVAIEREQVQLQRAERAQLFEQRHGQQPGRVGTEAIG